MKVLLVYIAILLLGGQVAFADLTAIKAEKNLEKRAKKALQYAETLLNQSKQDYRDGQYDKSRAALEEVGAAVVFAYESLKETGKNPGKNPGTYKRPEQKMRALLRQLADFRQEMDVADQPALDKVKAPIQKIHDQILLGILERKK